MLRKIFYQDNTCDVILSLSKKNMLSQSILLYGDAGIGKTSFALYLAAFARCLDVNKPCMKCSECIRVLNLNHPGIIFLDTDNIHQKFCILEELYSLSPQNKNIIREIYFLASDIINRFESGYLNIKSKGPKKGQSADIELLQSFKNKFSKNAIEGADILEALDLCKDISLLIKNDNIPAATIRDVMKKLYQSNFSGSKTVIISGIEKMREEGANAFLKTLEEPPADSSIILITSKINDVLPTIKSRCSLFSFGSLNEKQVYDIIQKNWDINKASGFVKGNILKSASSLDIARPEALYELLIKDIGQNLSSASKMMSERENPEEDFRNLLDFTNDKLKVSPDVLIEISKQVDIALGYITCNNADKLMSIESLLLSFYGIWRRALT